MEMKKAWNSDGVDWLEVIIPPVDDSEDEYMVRVHLTFMLSNWNCIFGKGCPGLFPKSSSTYAEDTGCCTHSFFFESEEEIDVVRARMEQLTDEDWDQDLRKHVEKNGWYYVKSKGKKVTDEFGEEVMDGWQAKGKVVDGACVFANRNGGSSGKIGCAFHHLGERLGQEHVDVMPTVCWQLPLRMTEVRPDLWELAPWDVQKWIVASDQYEFTDLSYMCTWWCIDTPEAYSGHEPVYRMMRRELIKILGEREYDIIVEAIEKRVNVGNVYPPMPGAVVNDGRPLLPLLIGNRTPRREPSDYPALLAKMKEDHDEE